MKITITGSLGHISKPLAEELISTGHDVTVISSKADKQKDIEALGAKAAIGSIEDVSFLTQTFKGADIVYCMEPPPNFFDKNLDMQSYYANVGKVYAQAIQQSGVKKVVHLSSIGAHTNKGNGMLASHYYVEETLRTLSENVAIKFMRPVGFYYNMFAFIPAIKNAGVIVQNYGDLTEPWVSPLDIAATIAEEMAKPFEGRTVRYIASEELSCNDVAKTLGEAIGKPDLKWQVISDEQMFTNLTNAGINEQAAKGLVEMNEGRRSSVLYEDYNKHKPVFGKVKLKDFAKGFAAAYHQ